MLGRLGFLVGFSAALQFPRIWGRLYGALEALGALLRIVTFLGERCLFEYVDCSFSSDGDGKRRAWRESCWYKYNGLQLETICLSCD